MMKIEIWSDVICPFCYIGKRRFEAALAQFPFRENVQLLWKSFQLSPDIKSDPAKSIHQYLVERKRLNIEEARRLNDQVAAMAANEGLNYNFDKTVVANSFNAHRFTHFAKRHNKQNEAEEKLFSAYFTEGKNIDDYTILIQLGSDIGLNTADVKEALQSGRYAENVKSDILEAQQIGIQGVPFFVFNRKYALAGAQYPNVFLHALEKSYNEWRKENPRTSLKN